jgi:hypothetical protein
MKPPSKSIGTSLLRQSVGGRGAEDITVSGMKRGAVSMIASGEGQVVASPGWDRGRRGERSAAVYGAVMRRFGGSGIDA